MPFSFLSSLLGPSHAADGRILDLGRLGRCALSVVINKKSCHDEISLWQHCPLATDRCDYRVRDRNEVSASLRFACRYMSYRGIEIESGLSNLLDSPLSIRPIP